MAQKYSKKLINQIIDLYTTNNYSASKIAEMLNLKSVATVRKYLKENNIHLKSLSELKHNNDTINNVIEMYKNGFSEDKISIKVNLCRKTIRDILNNNGIARRTNDQYREYSVDENYFESLDTNNKVYVLGLLYSDGNVSLKKYNIQLSLHKDDKEILEKINKDMKSNKPLYFKEFSKYNRNQNDQWGICICCKKMHNDLAKWGVTPQKTHIVKYPDFLKDNQHSHFIRGVIDGDGCIHPYDFKNHNCSIDINGTYDFCVGCKDVIESILGIHCSIIKINKNGSTYRTVISGKNQIKIFLDWIYNDAELYLKRKYDIYSSYCKKVGA